jgi:MFS family permease
MVNLDNTVLNVALPPSVRDLRAATTELQWIVDAYVLVFAGLLLVAGSVADRIGRKRAFCAGLAAFAAGSSWAAFSGSTGMLIGGAPLACRRRLRHRPGPAAAEVLSKAAYRWRGGVIGLRTVGRYGEVFHSCPGREQCRKGRAVMVPAQPQVHWMWAAG